jgi:hypothetical protein
MRAVKKITAFLLAMVMVLSLIPSAFAADDDYFDVTFDNQEPAAGDEITATVTLKKQFGMNTVKSLSWGFRYNSDYMTCTNVNLNGQTFKYSLNEKKSGEYASNISFYEYSDTSHWTSVPKGFKFEFTFEVTDEAAGQALNTSLDCYTYGKKFKLLSSEENFYSLTVAAGTGEPRPTATGYSVSMAADQQVAAGKTVSIPVTVASSKKKITGFNAYDMTFTYDPAALTLNTTSDSAANLTVEDNNGTVRVRRYGATQELGTALALEFTANKAASSTVTLTNAKFDIDANSINFDAPAAAITDADTAVKALWTVTLPDGFLSTAANASTLVEDGGDFTFKATDTHYEYYLNITTNGATSIKKMDKATYTIKNVTDNVTVTVDNKIGKTYTIKFVAVDSTTTVEEDKATVDDLVAYSTTTVQYPNDYKFTVKFPGTGYVVGVGIEPDKNKRDYVRQENGDYVYTLLGSSLTGDENNEITITLTKRENTSQHKIEVVGSGSDAFSENNALTFYSGENYTFTLNKNDTYYDYSVLVYYWKQNIGGNGGKNIRMEYKDNGDGTYTIIDMPYADVTISISKMAKAIDPDAVEVSTYVELDNKTVFKVVVVQGSHELLNRDQTTYSYTWFTYDGQKMYCNPRYTKFAGNGSSSSVYLVMVDKGETLTKEDAMAKLSIVTSTEQENKDQTLKVGSDVNEDGIGGVGINRRDVNDVQLIYDLYNGLYDSFETVSMRKFLKADVNCDGVLDSQDAVKLAGELFL